jgi:hypothetical protein
MHMSVGFLYLCRFPTHSWVSVPLVLQRAQLSLYESDSSSGYLTAPQLERYLADLVADTPHLAAAMDQSFMPHYVRITARKLLFFHGKRRAGRRVGRRQQVRHLRPSPQSRSGAGYDGRGMGRVLPYGRV